MGAVTGVQTLALPIATILPAAPGCYHKPQTIDDLVSQLVGRILQQLGIEQNLTPQWAYDESQKRQSEMRTLGQFFVRTRQIG